MYVYTRTPVLTGVGNFCIIGAYMCRGSVQHMYRYETNLCLNKSGNQKFQKKIKEFLTG